jgi:iron complex transport system substrate-binding protein
VQGYHGYKQLTDEAAIEAKPDVILMMTRGGQHDAGEAELFAHPAIAATPAGQAKRLIKMDGAYLLGFGPRTADAVKEVAAALYGDQVGN